MNAKPPPAKVEHLRHKRHAAELSVRIERFQDFFPAAYLDPIAYTQP
jgi:hypothetical protein